MSLPVARRDAMHPDSVPQGDQAVVATAALTQLFRNNRDTIADILGGTLSQGGFGVRFYLVTDANHISIHRVATAAIEVLGAGRMRLAASIATAEELSAVAAQRRPAIQAAPAEPGAVGAPDSEIEERVVHVYPLIQQQHHFDDMDGARRCPVAWRLFQRVREMFRDGIPLPHVEGFAWAALQVVYLGNPAGPSHWINYLRGERPIEQREAHPWTTFGVDESQPAWAFRQLLAQAQGVMAPPFREGAHLVSQESAETVAQVAPTEGRRAIEAPRSDK